MLLLLRFGRIMPVDPCILKFGNVIVLSFFYFEIAVDDVFTYVAYFFDIEHFVRVILLLLALGIGVFGLRVVLRSGFRFLFIFILFFIFVFGFQ